jgi:hypothetical protein
MIAAQSEIVTYWRGIIGTLAQRGLLRERRDGQKIIPQAVGLVEAQRVTFVLDMQRLAGVRREQWLDADLWAQWRATLQGRRCFVADGAGLAIVVGREPEDVSAKQLPAMIPLTQDEIPQGDYLVTLGHDRTGPVVLDVAGAHRAILVGGTTGAGKTNALQAILGQLVAKHEADQVQLAIVDTKQVDFAPWAGLEHLAHPIAHDLDDAQALIEHVEAERVRRQAVMVSAGVSDWRDAGLSLLVLAVDEAADFAGSETMDTLVYIARKGRAFGVSVLVGTQYPTSKVIDPQVKANLTTAIALQCRTQTESRVIIDRPGAEELRRPGLALTFVADRWRRVQILRGDLGDLIDVGQQSSEPILGETEAALVRYALQELDGAFTIGRLYDAHAGEISKHALTKLGQRWERRGWLTTPEHATASRRVTPTLKALVSGDALGTVGRDTGQA